MDSFFKNANKVFPVLRTNLVCCENGMTEKKNFMLPSIISLPKNMGIFAKFVVHKCALNIFFSICYADSENIMDISVSAWTRNIQTD